ncbi:MAG: polymorphic toxin-type HINT domain-containing protein [Planctomycetota bacterium]
MSASEVACMSWGNFLWHMNPYFLLEDVADGIVGLYEAWLGLQQSVADAAHQRNLNTDDPWSEAMLQAQRRGTIQSGMENLHTLTQAAFAANVALLLGGGPGSLIRPGAGMRAPHPGAKFPKSRGLGGAPGPSKARSLARKSGSAAARTSNGSIGCFLAGTQIEILDGPREIQDVREGDLVLARDPATGEQGYKRVVRLFRGHTDQVVYLRIAKAASTQRGRGERHRVGQEKGGSSSDGEDGSDPDPDSSQQIRCTTEHPFWVQGRGWVAAKDLKPGDQLLGSEGEQLVVTAHEVRQEEADHYNFEVEDWHTYFVSETEDDPAVWVHNTCLRSWEQPGGMDRLRASAARVRAGSGRHSLTGEVRRGGQTVRQGTYVSGAPGGGRLNQAESLATHTEAKFLAEGGIQAGDRLVMSGLSNPCAPGCAPAIRAAVEGSGASAIYRAARTGQTWRWQPFSHPTLKGTVLQEVYQGGDIVQSFRYWRNSQGLWTRAEYFRPGPVSPLD